MNNLLEKIVIAGSLIIIVFTWIYSLVWWPGKTPKNLKEIEDKELKDPGPGQWNDNYKKRKKPRVYR